MTGSEARAHFYKTCGLHYSDVHEWDIFNLAGRISYQIYQYSKRGKMTIKEFRVHDAIDINLNDDGCIRSAFIFGDSDYFEKRGLISFYSDGHIGFAGWGSSNTLEPIIKAFVEWCDHITEMDDAMEDDGR